MFQLFLGFVLLLAYFWYLSAFAEHKSSQSEQFSRLVQRRAERQQQEIEDWEDAHFL